MNICNLFIIFLIVLTISCTAPVKPDLNSVSLPDPAIDKLKVTVDIQYTDEFRTHKFVQHIPRSWDTFSYDIEIPVGPANVELFDELTNAMFAHVIRNDQIEHGIDKSYSADAVFKPLLKEMQFFVHPMQVMVTGLVLAYEIHLYTLDNKELVVWTIRSDQKELSQSEKFRAALSCLHNPLYLLDIRSVCPIENQMKKLFENATREIAAQFYARFGRLPEISAWLEKMPYKSNDLDTLQ